MAFSSESSFTCHTCCDTGPRFIRSHPKDQFKDLTTADEGLQSLCLYALGRIYIVPHLLHACVVFCFRSQATDSPIYSPLTSKGVLVTDSNPNTLRVYLCCDYNLDMYSHHFCDRFQGIPRNWKEEHPTSRLIYLTV
jgi:hypothetical protein